MSLYTGELLSSSSSSSSSSSPCGSVWYAGANRAKAREPLRNTLRLQQSAKQRPIAAEG